MPDRFIPTGPFTDADFPSDGRTPFPIVEVFGYEKHLSTPEARQSFADMHCPFADNPCEKYLQYGFGNCSVLYKTRYDRTPQVYATCDHRLDGVPVRHALSDYFGENERVRLTSELKFTNPDQSFDFIGIDTATDDFIVIETQAIDLRGGGVGPAWESIFEGKPAEWRQYFSREALQKKRKDNIAYGVNMANITKRLGYQVADKGSLLRQMGVKLYVIAQDICFRYFASRIPSEWTTDRNGDWDITFITFDYTGSILTDGKLEIAYRQTMRTTHLSFSEAISRSTSNLTRDDILKRVKEKLRRQSTPG
jgi:hypothetical protein